MHLYIYNYSIWYILHYVLYTVNYISSFCIICIIHYRSGSLSLSRWCLCCLCSLLSPSLCSVLSALCFLLCSLLYLSLSLACCSCWIFKKTDFSLGLCVSWLGKAVLFEADNCNIYKYVEIWCDAAPPCRRFATILFLNRLLAGALCFMLGICVVCGANYA